MVRALSSLLPLLLAVAASAVEARADDVVGFQRREIRTTHPIVQDPIPLHLEGADGRALLVVTSPDRKRVVVDLFSTEPIDEPATGVRLALPEDVVAYDLATTSRDAAGTLYFLTPTSILEFEPETGALGEVARVSSVYRRPVPGRLLELDFAHRLEGLSEPLFAVPDFDAFRVGRARLPILPRTTHGAWGPAYRPVDLLFGDVDLDGREDAFFVSDDALRVFHGSGGDFSTVGLTRALGLDVSRDLTEEDFIEADQSDLTLRRIVAIDDFDGDGLLDVLVESSHHEGVFERETAHELHLGRRGPNGLEFSREPTTRIQGDPPVGGIRTVDIDGDGRRDLAAGSVDFGLGTLVSALLSGAVDVDVRFYRLGEDGHYPEKPNATREARIEFDLSRGRASIPVVVLADVDGDGVRDLIVREDADELRVYRGDRGAGLFADDGAATIRVPLPQNGQLVSDADLNGDGRSDLMIRYGRQDGRDASRRLVLLLSEPTAEPRPAVPAPAAVHPRGDAGISDGR